MFYCLLSVKSSIGDFSLRKVTMFALGKQAKVVEKSIERCLFEGNDEPLRFAQRTLIVLKEMGGLRTIVSFT